MLRLYVSIVLGQSKDRQVAGAAENWHLIDNECR